MSMMYLVIHRNHIPWINTVIKEAHNKASCRVRGSGFVILTKTKLRKVLLGEEESLFPYENKWIPIEVVDAIIPKKHHDTIIIHILKNKVSVINEKIEERIVRNAKDYKGTVYR